MFEVVGSSPVLANGATVPLSPATKANGLVFVSGQLGLNNEGKVVSDDVAEQTRATLERISSILEQA